MNGWISAADIAVATKHHKRYVQKLAAREGWGRRRREGRGGGWDYRIEHLPAAWKTTLATRAASDAATQARAEGMDGYARRQAVRAAVDGRARQRAGERGLARLAQLKGRDLARAEARLTVLEACAEFERHSSLSKTEALTAFCAAWNAGKIEVAEGIRAEIGLTYPALIYRWRAMARSEGLARLAGAYGNRKGCGLIDSHEELLRFAVAMLTQAPTSTGKNLHRAMRARFGEREDVKLPSLASVQRWVRAFRRENAELMTAVANPDAWKNKYMSAFGCASESVKRLNELWESDATPADVMLADGRHHVMGVIDVFSRRATLLVTRTSTAQAVCTSLRRALLAWGVPETLKTDNGSDYTSKRVRRVVDALKVDQKLCSKFSGWEKPHIERLFRTFAHGIVELLPGFIGHNVAERSAIEARASFAERLMKKNEVVEINMTAADFQRFCDEWLANIYHAEEHRGIGTTPALKAAGHSCRRIADERALDILLADGGMRTVTKKGLRIDGIGYIAPELGALVGAPVHVQRDPDDLGRILVFHLGEFVCSAEAPEFTGMDRKLVAATARERQKARVQKARRELRRAARKEKVSDIAQEILAERGRAADASNVMPLPGRSQPYESAGLTAAAAAVAAREARDAEPVPTPVSREAVAEIAGMLRDEQRKDETADERFRRWISLHEAELRGETLCETDAAWKRYYEPLPECSGRMMIYDEFGGASFGAPEKVEAPIAVGASGASTQ